MQDVDVNKTKSELISELNALRQRVAQLEQLELQYQRSPVTLLPQLQLQTPQYSLNQPQIDVAGCNIKWNVTEGIFTLEQFPCLMMWVDTTLPSLMASFQAMVGTERFVLALQSYGRNSVEEIEWGFISQYPTFEIGFAVLANMAAVAGWGDVQLISIDRVNKQGHFRVKNSWEGRYQKSLGVCWGSSVTAGKLAGFCSKLFETNCWSEQTSFIARGDEFDEFIVQPSEKSIEDEIEKLLLTDNATRADMAVALQRLRQEISERLASEAALKESEARYRRIIETAQEGIWLIDAEHKTTFANQKIAEMLGYTVEEMLGMPLFAFMGAENQKMVAPRLKLRQQGITEQYDSRFRRKDGSDLWALVSTAPILDEKGKYTGALAMITDITERKKAEQFVRESEERFRLIAENSTDIISRQSPDRVMLYVSPACRSILGYEPEELMGHSTIEVVHPDDLAQIAQIYPTPKDLPNTYTVTYRARHKNGYYVWLETSVKVIRDSETGEIIESQASSRDITERKQAEQALRQINQTLQAIIQACPLAIMGLSADGIVRIWNPAAERIFGWSQAEVLERFLPAIPDSKKNEFLENLNKTIKGNLLVSVEAIRQKKDGSPIDVSLWSAPLNESECGISCISVVADISERKQVEFEREQILKREQAAREVAEAANRIKDEFLAVLSHELRTPLNPILGWTKLLRTRKFDEGKTAFALETIERNAKLQTQLIEDLLDVSRILQGKLALNVSQVDLILTVEAAIETVRLAAEAKSINLQFLIGDISRQAEELAIVSSFPRLPLLVTGDSNRLQQVIWNLLTNAIKFTPEGGRVEVRLSVISKEREQGIGHSKNSVINTHSSPVQNYYVQVQVVDTGKGISSEFLPHVFDYFRQADSSTTRKFGGLGLGLAIARHLVELHGGTIWAESKGIGQGTTLTIRLPLLKQKVETIDDEVNLSNSMSAPSLQDVRVLVVDDDTDSRDFAAFLLKQYGADVTTAASAAEALLALRQSKPEIIVSDIGMPEEDGYVLIRQIRSLAAEQGGAMKAIALTAYAGESDRLQILAAGFDRHITKPVEPTELVEAIISLLDLNE